MYILHIIFCLCFSIPLWCMEEGISQYIDEKFSPKTQYFKTDAKIDELLDDIKKELSGNNPPSPEETTIRNIEKAIKTGDQTEIIEQLQQGSGIKKRNKSNEKIDILSSIETQQVPLPSVNQQTWLSKLKEAYDQLSPRAKSTGTCILTLAITAFLLYNGIQDCICNDNCKSYANIQCIVSVIAGFCTGGISAVNGYNAAKKSN